MNFEWAFTDLLSTFSIYHPRVFLCYLEAFVYIQKALTLNMKFRLNRIFLLKKCQKREKVIGKERKQCGFTQFKEAIFLWLASSDSASDIGMLN